MKKNILHLLTTVVLTLLCVTSQGQYSPIKTPTNVTVEAYSYDELPSGVLEDIEVLAADWIDDHDSDAEWIAPASGTYNCHAYAWHVKDGGNNVWLNAHDDIDDDPEILKKYWSGASPTYTQTSTVNSTV